MDLNYKNQVKLLIDVLPYIAKEECFALKGGTAINLFYNNLPIIFDDYIIDKLQINAIKHSNKSDVIIPKSLIDESLSIIQQAVNKAKD